jgi:serine protease Do
MSRSPHHRAGVDPIFRMTLYCHHFLFRSAALTRRPAFALLALAFTLGWLPAHAQLDSSSSTLPRSRFLNGTDTLHAFAPISDAARQSVVRLSVDQALVALGTVMDTNGLVLTKASELKKGKLTCWLSDKEVPAELIGTDDEEDLALVRVKAQGLKPVQWAEENVAVGQWAITPGTSETPSAVGIISALPRRIRPRRALIGVQFDVRTPTPRIDQLLAGLGAEKAGLKPGDVISGVNGSSVTNREQITEILREFREGQTVKLRIQRAEDEFDADVTMMPPPEQTPGLFSSRQRSLSRVTGEVSQRAEGFEKVIEHDTVLQPWLCGGPLLNLQGKAVGLNIARAGRVTTYALPAELVERTFERLKATPVSTTDTGK